MIVPEKKYIKDYLHFYPKCPIIITEKSPIDYSEIRTSHYLEGIDWGCDKVIAERVNWDWNNIKLILKPVRKLTEDEFVEICKFLWQTDEIKCIFYKDRWLSTDKELFDEEKLESFEDENEDDVDGEIFNNLDEANYDNVISYSPSKYDFDFFYGADDEYRYTLDLEDRMNLTKKLLEMRFDLFDLIGYGLAEEEKQ